MIRAIKEFLVGFMYGFKIGYRQAIAKRKIAGQMFAVSSTYQLVAVSGVEVSVKLVSNQTLLEAMGHTTACAFTNSAATGGDGAYWIVVGDEFHGATPEVQSLILSHEEGHIFLGHCDTLLSGAHLTAKAKHQMEVDADLYAVMNGHTSISTINAMFAWFDGIQGFKSSQLIARRKALPRNDNELFGVWSEPFPTYPSIRSGKGEYKTCR